MINRNISSCVGVLLALLTNMAHADVPPTEVPDSLHTDVPGQIQAVGWGWLGSLYYQVVPYTGYSPEEYKQRMIDTPLKWGANLLEFYPPYFHQSGGPAWPMPWPDGLSDFPRPQRYNYYPDPRWGHETFIDLTRYCHDHGMLVQWFLHPKPVINDRLDENLLSWRFLARQYSDSLSMPVRDLLDGMGWEVWFDHQTGNIPAQQWASNPGMFCYSTHTRPDHFPPSYSKAYMCSAGGRPMGRDDQFAMEDTPIGSVPLGYQADARPLPITDPAWSMCAYFSQGTFGDWILKQAEDFFRRNIIAGDRCDAHSIWWLGEPESTLTPEVRPYVYAASIDPIRHAAATRLTTTGLDGYADRLHRGANSPILHRYEHPFDAAYIGNNYLRLYRHSDRDTGTLIFDPGRTGEYDENANARLIADAFLKNDAYSAEQGALSIRHSQCLPPRHLLKTQYEAYGRDGLPDRDAAIWQIGRFDASAEDLGDEGAYEDPFTYEVDQSAKQFPPVMTVAGRSVQSIHIRFHTHNRSVRLLLGQKATGPTENILIAIAGKTVGQFTTRSGGDPYWLHRTEPFLLPNTTEQTVTLTWDGTGGGFEFDALALVAVTDGKADEPQGLAPKNMVIDWDQFADIPGGLGPDGTYPQFIALNIDLPTAGRYELTLHQVSATEPTPFTLFVDDQFGPGFGQRPEDGLCDQTMAFTVTEPGRHTLKLSSNLIPHLSWESISLRRVSQSTIEHKFVEPGGHLARMVENIHGAEYTDRRVYKVIGDFPAMRVDVQRQLYKPGTSRLALGLAADRMRLNGEPIDYPYTLPDRKTYLVADLKDQDIRVGLQLADYPPETTMQPIDGQLYLLFPKSDSLKCAIRIGLIDTLYDAEDLQKAMGVAFDPIEVSDIPANINNPLAIPMVRLLKIDSRDNFPYIVRESGRDGEARWILRGAQPQTGNPNVDYVKIYLQANDTARIASFGWYEGTARPAHGCQHILALSDLHGNDRQAGATVRVLQSAPHIFAPGIMFKKPIVSATVNDQPWAYFEENILRLPVERGDYRVQVSFRGQPMPHLRRTCAAVSRATYVDGRLEIDGQLPPWSDSMPDDLEYTFLIDAADKTVGDGKGYKILRSADNRAIIQAPPGRLSVSIP